MLYPTGAVGALIAKHILQTAFIKRSESAPSLVFLGKGGICFHFSLLQLTQCNVLRVRFTGVSMMVLSLLLLCASTCPICTLCFVALLDIARHLMLMMWWQTHSWHQCKGVSTCLIHTYTIALPRPYKIYIFSLYRLGWLRQLSPLNPFFKNTPSFFFPSQKHFSNTSTSTEDVKTNMHVAFCSYSTTLQLLSHILLHNLTVLWISKLTTWVGGWEVDTWMSSEGLSRALSCCAKMVYSTQHFLTGEQHHQ